VKFELGTKTVTLDSPAQYPYKQNTSLAQAKEQSSTGVTHVEDFQLKNGTFTYIFNDMSDNDHAKLLDFFVNDAVGMFHKYYLTDDIGVRRLMRFTSPDFDFETDFKGLWQGQFSAEEQI